MMHTDSPDDHDRLVDLIKQERAHVSDAWTLLLRSLDHARKDPDGMASIVGIELDHLMALVNAVGLDQSLQVAGTKLMAVIEVANAWDDDPTRALRQLLTVA